MGLGRVAQMLIEATSMCLVIRSRLSYGSRRPDCLSLLKQRSHVLRFLYQPASNAGGRPRPGRGHGGVSSVFLDRDHGLDAVLAQPARFAREEYAYRPSRGRAPARPAQAPPPDADGVHQRDEPRGITCWPQLVSRAMEAAQVSGQWILVSARRGTAIASRPGFLSSLKPPVRSSAAGTRGAGCVLTGPGDGESALTVQSLPRPHHTGPQPSRICSRSVRDQRRSGYRWSSVPKAPAGPPRAARPGTEEDPVITIR